MKKALKFVFIVICIILILAIGLIFYAISITSKVELDQSKLINLNRTTAYYYADNSLMSEQSNGTEITEIEKIKPHTVNAFIAIEDKRFFSHKGIDYKRLLSATFNNIKSASFKEGGSTISQQLIKNTHFSSEKTIKRKLSEIKLAKELEKKYSKNQILEKYLNTIYFGENCYGITEASRVYFNKEVSKLTLNESAVLAAVIKAPSNYSPFVNENKCFNRKNLVLKAMQNQGYITSQEYEDNCNVMPNLNEDKQKSRDVEYDYLYYAKGELKNFNASSPYSSLNLSVFTNCDKGAQEILKNQAKNQSEDYLISAILIDKENKICAYYSNCGDINRQLGSIIKPIIAYAPAIEKGLVYPHTYLIDEKTDFNGYSPSNYNDVYYGKTTVKKSLEKSMNVCAVKLLNYVGVDSAKSYAQNVGLSFSATDNGLCLALGASENGEKLSKITSAYSVFLNDGKFSPAFSISAINHGEATIKKHTKKTNYAFSEETVSFMNDMLKSTVTEGTAKKLSFLDFPVYAKTGTVGNENGNTDAYVISYTKDYVLGCWVGNREGALLSNAITGGGLPTIISKDIWEQLYKNKPLPGEIEISGSVVKAKIDKISYDEDEVMLLADERAPSRYVEEVLIRKKDLPKNTSKRFSSPKIKNPELQVKYNRIDIRLCLTELYGVEVYKLSDKKKYLLADVFGKENYQYSDTEVLPNEYYSYSFLPYFKTDNGSKIYGEEIVIDKIKSPSNALGEEWWAEG